MEKDLLFKLIENKKVYRIHRKYDSYDCYLKQKLEIKEEGIKSIKTKKFLKIINKSKYYQLYKNMINGLKESYLYDSYIHGIRHNFRVSLYAFYLGIKYNVDEDMLKLIMYASLYHDIGRVNDSRDDYHGSRSANMISELNLDVTSEELKMLQVAIKCHSLPDEEFDKNLDGIVDVERCRLLFKILKDSDGLDRVRLEYPYVKIEMLRLEESKRLIPLNYEIEYWFWRNRNG